MNEGDEIIKHRHRILEAIDQLRRRKARPDVNRICSFMFRRFSVSCGETKTDLQKLIDAEVVIKVDYKGNTSYRNAAKWAMLPNYKNKQELDSCNTTCILSSAIAELIVMEPDFVDIGIPELDLEKQLLKKEKRFTKKNVETILKREIDNGTLVKLENGNFYLGDSNSTNQNNSHSSSSRCVNRSGIIKPKTKKLKPKSTLGNFTSTSDSMSTQMASSLEGKEYQKDESGTASNFNNSENVGFRVGGRQKRAKVMFDPSDNNLPKVSRKRAPGRPPLNVVKHMSMTRPGSSILIRSQPPSSLIVSSSSSTPAASTNQVQPAAKPVVTPNTCCFCHTFAGLKLKGVPERLISCTDCLLFKAHCSCIEARRQVPENKSGVAMSISKLLPWKCHDCTRCVVCKELGKVGKLAMCSLCGDAYHHLCHDPRVSVAVAGDKWVCAKCCPDTGHEDHLDMDPDYLSKMNEEDLIEEIEEEEEEMEEEEKPHIAAINNSDHASNSSCESPTADTNRLMAPTVNISTTATVPTPKVADTTTYTTDAADDIDDKDDIKPLFVIESNDYYTGSSCKENTFPKKSFSIRSQFRDNGYGLSAVERGVLPASCALDPYEGHPIDESIPDASHWSCQQVYQYFFKQFGMDIAQIFIDQEIDGHALLLLRRSDIVTGLDLRLGVALKVYRHVRKLQIRRSNLKFVWL